MPLPLLFRFLRAPGLPLATVATLGVGIGALLTTFMLVDAALWRAPPLPDADRIALLYTTRVSPSRPLYRERWSFAAITLLRPLTADLADVANYSRTTLTLTGGEEPESITGEIVSARYFSILGTGALIGRTFVDSEDVAPGAHAVMVLSYDLWQRRYGGAGDILGRTSQVNGVTFTIIGVMPQGFRGLTDQAQLWVPTMMAPFLNYPEYLTTNQNFISVVARLRPSVDLSRARTAMEILGKQIHGALPVEDPDPAETVSATAVSLNEARVDRLTRRSLLVLFSAVALLYLLACANATNLLLGRAVSRRREAAILAALGGAPRQLLRRFLPEGITLVTASALLAVLLASWAIQFVAIPATFWGPRNFYGSLAPFAEPRIDLRFMVFTVALTLVTMLLVAWAPAASSTRMDILAALREGSRGAAGRAGTLRHPTLRGGIVALEAALAMLLLVGAGLMIDSFVRMRRTDLGIDPNNVLTFWLVPPEVRVPTSAAPAYISRMLQAISAVPGVVAVTVDGGAPVSGTARSTLFIAGRPAPRPENAPPVLRHYIAPDHFSVLRVPLLRGRLFNAGDIAGRPRVAIISASAASRFWPDQDPLGQRVWFGGGSSFDRPDSSAQIVGIVGDVVHEPLDVTPNRNDFYTPYPQFTYASRMFMVRTAGDPLQYVSAIRRAVQSVDPDRPLLELQTLTALIGSSWSRQRFDATLFGAFAVVALLLATSGIYAVVSYAVGQRTREMGIRMALGAQPPAIVRLILREGMGFPALGLLAGLAASLLLGHFLQAALYEVTPADPVVLISTIGVLLLASLFACYTPARRATRQDPLIALRAD